MGRTAGRASRTKISLPKIVEPESGRTVVAKTGRVPSKVVARNSDDEYRDPGKEAGRRPRLRKAHLRSLHSLLPALIEIEKKSD